MIPPRSSARCRALSCTDAAETVPYRFIRVRRERSSPYWPIRLGSRRFESLTGTIVGGNTPAFCEFASFDSIRVPELLYAAFMRAAPRAPAARDHVDPAVLAPHVA